MSNSTAPRTGVTRVGGPQALLPLAKLVDDWVAEGIISPDQADRIRARGEVSRGPEPERREHAERSSLAVEALGYLGGVIVVVATMLIAAWYWTDITTAGRLVIVGVAAAALLAVGFAVPDRIGDVGVRLRSILWLASTVAVAGFLGILGSELLDLGGNDVALLTTAGTATFATALWTLRRAFVQQATMMVALMATSAAAIADFVTTDSLPGLGAWGVAGVWVLLGWGGILGPRRVVVDLGAVAILFGAVLTMSYDSGIVLAMATAAAVVFAAVLFRDLVLLAVGTVGSLVILPAPITRWFPDSLAAPFALLVVGALLVGAAVWIARRRVRRPKVGRTVRDYSVGEPTVALSAATAVVVAVAATVLVIALV